MTTLICKEKSLALFSLRNKLIWKLSKEIYRQYIFVVKQSFIYTLPKISLCNIIVQELDNINIFFNIKEWFQCLLHFELLFDFQNKIMIFHLKKIPVTYPPRGVDHCLKRNFHSSFIKSLSTTIRLKN